MGWLDELESHLQRHVETRQELQVLVLYQVDDGGGVCATEVQSMMAVFVAQGTLFSLATEEAFIHSFSRIISAANGSLNSQNRFYSDSCTHSGVKVKTSDHDQRKVKRPRPTDRVSNASAKWHPSIRSSDCGRGNAPIPNIGKRTLPQKPYSSYCVDIGLVLSPVLDILFPTLCHNH